MIHNLRKSRVLATLLLTILLVAIAAGQENKNRRGDGSSVPPDAAKGAEPSKKEANPGNEQTNSPSDPKEDARKARQERHRRNP